MSGLRKVGPHWEAAPVNLPLELQFPLLQNVNENPHADYEDEKKLTGIRGSVHAVSSFLTNRLLP